MKEKQRKVVTKDMRILRRLEKFSDTRCFPTYRLMRLFSIQLLKVRFNGKVEKWGEDHWHITLN
jgi:hypothetical protein